MRNLLLIAILPVVGLSCGCAAGQYDITTPQGKTAKYPSVISDGDKRRQTATTSWAAMLEERNLQPLAPDLEPFTQSIRALPASLAGRIRITEKEGDLTPIQAREALRNFIDRHDILLLGDAGLNETVHKTLSLTAFSVDGNFFRATWVQANYPYEIENGYGILSIAISRQGALLQLSSRLIPTVHLPTEPLVTSRQLTDRMIGRVFTYSNIAGQPQTYKVAAPEDVQVKKPVIYPVQEGSALAIRLAIPVEVGSGMTWTVFIDAIDGRELGVRQNFQS